MNITKNTAVTLQFKSSDTTGKLLDQSQEPIAYLHGGYGNTFPKIEEALEGQAAGFATTIELAPADAFGEYNEALLQTIPKTQFPPGVKVGGQLEGRGEDGLVDPVLARRAGINTALLGSWEDIVGENFADCTRPEKIAWPRRDGSEGPSGHQPGTLTIACEGARALFLSHQQGEQVAGDAQDRAVHDLAASHRCIEGPVGHQHQAQDAQDGRVLQQQQGQMGQRLRAFMGQQCPHMSSLGGVPVGPGIVCVERGCCPLGAMALVLSDSKVMFVTFNRLMFDVL